MQTALAGQRTVEVGAADLVVFLYGRFVVAKHHVGAADFKQSFGLVFRIFVFVHQFCQCRYFSLVVLLQPFYVTLLEVGVVAARTIQGVYLVVVFRCVCEVACYVVAVANSVIGVG